MAKPNSRPLLAGVCSRLAGLLGWKAWGLRAAGLVLLVLQPLVAIVSYLSLAAIFHLLDHRGDDANRGPALRSPELAARARKIEELDRRLGNLG